MASTRKGRHVKGFKGWGIEMGRSDQEDSRKRRQKPTPMIHDEKGPARGKEKEHPKKLQEENNSAFY